MPDKVKAESVSADETTAAEPSAVSDVAVESEINKVNYETALRKVSAMESILKAHQIDMSVMTNEALSAIPIVDGVAGKFAYQAPRPAPTTSPKSVRMGGNQPVALTIDQIEAMSETEINNRWEEVSAVLDRKGK